MATIKVNIGAAIRPAFRRLCGRLNLTLTEYPGWLESHFVVSGSERGIGIIRGMVEQFYQEDADAKAAVILANIEKRRRRHNRWYRRAWRAMKSRPRTEVVPTHG